MTLGKKEVQLEQKGKDRSFLYSFKRVKPSGQRLVDDQEENKPQIVDYQEIKDKIKMF